MEKKTEIIENFKKAITATVRSIIGDQHIEVIFGSETKKKIKKLLTFQTLRVQIIKLIT